MSNQRVVGQNNFIIVTNSGRSMRFVVPIKKNSRGAQVYALRKFLGISGNSDYFDKKTKDALMDWQDRNKNAIMELGGWQIEGRVGEQAIELSLDTSEWIEEYGQVGAATFVAMKNAGKTIVETFSTGTSNGNVNVGNAPGMSLESAVDATLSDLRGKGIGSVENPVAALSDAVPPSDVPVAPSADEQYYYYTWISNDSRAQVGENVEQYIRSKSEEALRKGVDFILTHFNKAKTWRIGGNDDLSQQYSQLLQYQGRLPPGATIPSGQTYTFTVEAQSLAQSVGLVDGSSEPVIDVLFGQSLAEGAKTHFASIKKIHTPNLRPLSTFKWAIRVRRDMLEGVSSSEDPIQSLKDDYQRLKGYYEDGKELYEDAKKLPGEIKERYEQVEDYVEEKIDQVEDALEYAYENPWEATKKVGKAAYSAANKLKRKAEQKALKELGITPGLTAAQRDALFADQLAKEISTDSLPAAVEYDAKKFMTRIRAVADKMEEYSEKINKWKADGGRVTPNINLAAEAGRLKSLVAPLTAFMVANGKNISPISSGKFRIVFDKVVKTRKINGSPQQVVVGARPVGISWGDPSKKQELKNGSIGLFIASPFNNPRTMGYLMHLNEMYEKSEGGVLGIFCGDPSLGGLAMEFLMKYTYPSPSILASTPYGSEIKIKINVYGAVKKAKEQLDERLTLLQNKGVGAVFKDGLYKVERGKTYNVTDFLPKFELCTLEQLYAEFLNKFDFWVLFCDYASCIPELPWPLPFEWDFDFKIPPLPKIPSFDPIKFIIPRLEAMLVDLIIGFLCALVRAIIDMISIPNCHDLLAYGKAALDWIMKDRSNNIGDDHIDQLIFDPNRQEMTSRERTESMLKAKAAMDEMGIPDVSLAAIGEIFEQVSLALTPSELCALLNGSAQGEVIMIVRKIIVAHPSDMKVYLEQEDDIEEFFSHLGSFIDPAICEKLTTYGDIVLGDVYCPDEDESASSGYNSIRKALEESGASPEEIRRALQDAQLRREALQALMKNNPLDNVIPSKIGVGGLPGPYDNDHFAELLELAAKGTLDTIEMTFKTDMRGYVPSFYSPIQRELTPDDPDYNHVAMARHRFVANQVLEARMKNSRREISEAMMKIKKPGEIIFELDENGDPTQYVKEVKPGIRIIKKDSDGTLGLPKKKKTPDYFNLTEPGDSRLFEELLMMPLSNVRAEMGVQPEYTKYLSEPRNNQVMIRSSAYPKYTSSETLRQFMTLNNYIINASSAGSFDWLSNPELNQELVEQIEEFGRVANSIGSDNPLFEGVFNFNESQEGDILGSGEVEIPGWLLQLRKRAQTFQFQQRKYTEILQNNLGKFLVSPKQGPQVLYRLRSVTSRPVTRAGGTQISQSPAAFVDELISEADAINCQMVDHYFMNNVPKDCFQVDRAPRFFESRSASETELDELNTFYYSSEVSDIMDSLRRRAPDMSNGNTERKKLLRPEAFAQLVFESFKSSVDILQERNIPLYPPNIPDGESNFALKEWNTESYMWKQLSYNITEDDTRSGHFSLLTQRFMDKIATSVSKSRYFTLEGLGKLNTDLTQEFVKKTVVDDNGNEKECLVKKKLLFDFQDLRKKAIKDFASLSQTEKHDPKNRNFSDPGPVEEALITQLISLYIKTFIGELVLKGLYVFSRFDAKHILQMPHIKEYIAEYIYVTIDKDFRRTKEYKFSFIEKIKELTNTEDDKESLKIITEKVIENDENLISELATELFQPEYFSYKEEFFNELISKYINSKTGIELLPYATRNYGDKKPRFVEDYYKTEGLDPDTLIRMTNNEYIKYLNDVLYVERSVLATVQARLIALRFAYLRYQAILSDHNSMFANLPEQFIGQIEKPELFEINGDNIYFTSIPLSSDDDGTESKSYFSRFRNQNVKNAHIVDFNALYEQELRNEVTRGIYTDARALINKSENRSRLQAGKSEVENPPVGAPGRLPNRFAGINGSMDIDYTTHYEDLFIFRRWKDRKRSSYKEGRASSQIGLAGVEFLQTLESIILEKISATRQELRETYTEWHKDQVDQYRDIANRPGQSVMSWFDWNYTEDAIYKAAAAYTEVERTSKNTASSIDLPETQYKNKSYLDSFNTRVFKDSQVYREEENAINTQLEKNAGYFMLENFFYIKDNGQDKLYLPSLIEKIIPHCSFETVTGNENAGKVLVETEFGDMINADYHFMLSKRMSISDYEILIERLKRMKIKDGPGDAFEYRGQYLKDMPSRITIKGDTFDNPIYWVRANTVFGLRLVYVPGYGDPLYENQLLEADFLQPKDYKYMYPENPNQISESEHSVMWQTEQQQAVFAVVNDHQKDNVYSIDKESTKDIFKNSVFASEGSALYMNDEYRFRFFQSMTKTGRAYLNKPVSYRSVDVNPDFVQGNNEFETFTFEVASVIQDVEAFVDYCGNSVQVSQFFDDGDDKFGREFPGKEIAARMKDTVIRKLLGTYKDEQGVYRLDSDVDAEQNIKLLFDDIFPLDRLSTLYFINEEGFFDKSPNFRNFLAATRATTRRIYRVMLNKSDVNVGDEEQLDGPSMYGLINSSMGSMGPDNRENSIVNEFLEDIVPQLIKMVLMAIPTMIRGLAVGFDPGFGSMKKAFEQDPCKLEDGMSWGSIKGPPYLFPKAHPLAGLAGASTKQLDDGFDNSNPCAKNFAPMTFGAPVDIGLGAGWLVTEIIKSILGAGNPVPPALTLANSVQHLVNSVKGKDTMSYGSFLGPVGMIGLSMPQLPGEDPSKRQEEANCAEKECGETGDDLEVVPDPCDELEEEQ